MRKKKMITKKINFEGWENCIEFKNGDFKLIATTEIGPRIIGAFLGKSPNLLYVDPAKAGKKGGDEWNIYGGHRLWHSPEGKPRSYAPDNEKVEIKNEKDGIVFSSGTESTTGINKSFKISPIGKNSFKIKHVLRNDNLWEIELAAWALSVMDAGGCAIVPQAQGDKKALLPNKYVTMWPYTNMNDHRITWGDRYIFLKQDSKAKRAAKFGINCEDGWLAYVNKGYCLRKKFNHLIDAEYPDNGCSIECYSCNFMLEIETLSPLYLLPPGEKIVHEEIWDCFPCPTINTENDASKFLI